jgi:hypothetical protein
VKPILAVYDEQGLFILGKNDLGFEAKPIFTDKVISLGMLSQTRLLMRGPDYIAACDLDGKNVARFALPEILAKGKALQAGILPDDALAVIARAPTEEQYPSEAYKISREGQVLWEQKIPRWDFQLPKKPPSWGYFIPGTSPILLPILASLDFQWHYYFYMFKSWFREEAPELRFADYWPLCAKLVACAALVFVWTRKWGFSLWRALGWSFYAFLGGIPAVLAIWAVLLNEKRVRCPSCGRKTPPSLERCHNCGAAWPPPARRETDIFTAEEAREAAAVGSGSTAAS